MLEAEKQQFEEVVQELRMEQEQIKRWWWCPGGEREEGTPGLGHLEPTFRSGLDRPLPRRSSLLDNLVQSIFPMLQALGWPRKSYRPHIHGPLLPTGAWSMGRC